REAAVVTVQYPVAHALAELRAARLARRDDVVAGPAHGVGRKGDVRRLADALDAFERDERAAHHCCERIWRRWSRTARSCSSRVAEKLWLPSPRPVAPKYR